MDNRIRRNEVCVVGLPRCDYVFSSTRSCFIAYGFSTSSLEVSILRTILQARGIEAIEAGGMRAPGESAFCVKICSKIITAQFCIALINNDLVDGKEVSNANVNMEYGLILGFNKYVLPFQREGQVLPFNVSGLDTIKYSTGNFPELAEKAIDQAISRTTPKGTAPTDANQRIGTYLMTRELVYSRIEDEGEKAIYDLGIPLGFNLLHNFAGTEYVYFGNFTHLRAEEVIWRVRMLGKTVDGRRSSWTKRVQLGIMTRAQARNVDEIFSKFRILLLVNSDAEREAVRGVLTSDPAKYATEAIAASDVEAALKDLIPTRG